MLFINLNAKIGVHQAALAKRAFSSDSYTFKIYGLLIIVNAPGGAFKATMLPLPFTTELNKNMVFAKTVI